MSFSLVFTEKALEDIAEHKKAGDKAILNKMKNLLEDISEHPFTGIGKPEPLKYTLSGMWSRRINREHRLVYEVRDQTVIVLSLKGHYER